MIIEIDEREVTVTSKKRKHKEYQSDYHLEFIQKLIQHPLILKWRGSSLMERFSRFQSGCHLTDQEKTNHLDTSDIATRRVDIRMNTSTQVCDKRDSGQKTKVDTRVGSSQTSSNDQDESSCKVHRIHTRTDRGSQIKNTSDTSTSFASLPPITPKSMLDTLTNIKLMLEKLDSTGPDSEELKRLQQSISPVSTSETPLPRTMMMPSNIPYPDRIQIMLRFSLNDSQINDSTILSSTQKDQSTLTDLQKSVVSKHISTSSQQLASKICTCKNPQCKLLHMKLDDIHDYALKNCPEMLQKYEDLQNLCTERIASLIDLIEKVRNGQKDMDFSLINRSDDINLMQLSTPSIRGEAQVIRTLIDNIEAIEAQLTKALRESRFMRKNETVSKDKTLYDTESKKK